VDDNKFESVYSSKVKAGKRRTYFFDVRKTKGDDYYITLTESTKRYNGDGYDRHKIFLYKEDFNRFQNSLTEVIDHIKTDLMPDYDYEEYTRRQEEWEAKIAEEDAAAAAAEASGTAEVTTTEEESAEEEESSEGESTTEEKSSSSEDDMSW
jgi:hypothetical protein